MQGKTCVHTVDLGRTSDKPSCTCLDWIKHHIPCKHMFAIFEHKADWSWNSLPQQYFSQPHLQTHFSATVNTSDPTPSQLPDDDIPCFEEISDRKVKTVTMHVFQSLNNYNLLTHVTLETAKQAEAARINLKVIETYLQLSKLGCSHYSQFQSN